MERLTHELFQRRVRESIARFPGYAERVRAHCGELPKVGRDVQLQELPVWTRDDQRALFASEPRPAVAAYAHQTSGSTAKPVRFYVTRESYEWRSAVMDRSYSWAMAEEGRRSVYLWAVGKPSTGLSHRVKHFVHLVLQRRTFYDIFQQIGPEELAAMCRLIDRVRPEALVGYTSALVDLARYVRDNPGVLSWKTPTMVNAAEGLMPGQRDLLEEHVVGEVFLSYGSREFMNIGMECKEHRGYHIATDNVIAEVVDGGGQPVAPGETGRIVVTDLRNDAAPFVRYEIGDLGVMAPPDESCPCGRPFPLLRSVEGRLQDTVVTPDGRRITALYVTYVMRQFDDWIDGYQVVQDTRDHITVRLLARAELTPQRLAPVTDLMRNKLGADMRIDYERADVLQRRPSGKIDLVISSLGSDG
jgi:phenylacetate-CoA ligase